MPALVRTHSDDSDQQGLRSLCTPDCVRKFTEPGAISNNDVNAGHAMFLIALLGFSSKPGMLRQGVHLIGKLKEFVNEHFGDPSQYADGEQTEVRRLCGAATLVWFASVFDDCVDIKDWDACTYYIPGIVQDTMNDVREDLLAASENGDLLRWCGYMEAAYNRECPLIFPGEEDGTIMV